MSPLHERPGCDSPIDQQLEGGDLRRIKAYYAKRWLDPIARIEDIFNVRRADGSITPLKVPEPQKQMIRDGILGKSAPLVGTGASYIGVTNKGRQIGFSVICAAEAILIAEDYPGTFIYYVATASEQASDWTLKLDQLIRDSNNWPPELGGRPIINAHNIEKVFEKNINGTLICGLSANPSGIRGKTGVAVYFDEAAWAIRVANQAKETWKALKYIIRQGGSARIQSTPRTSDEEEFFWSMYKKGDSGDSAIHTYTCPVITNWQRLDLTEPLWIDLDNTRRVQRGMREITELEKTDLIEKYKHREQFITTETDIQQKADIPYWWVNISDLEQDRSEDIEQFKQENLGIPLDETYKVLKSEWIYTNLNAGDEWDSRGNSTNPFYICIDLAQVNDITAITVVEKVEDVYIERLIMESQEKYDKQAELILSLTKRFTPVIVSFDNTGHGRVVGDILEKLFRENRIALSILKRVDFTQPLKEQMVSGFRNIVMPDALTGKSRYRWLHKLKKHEDAIRHCMRVEKEIYATGIRYSGKMHGRDDHFWAKSQIALYDINIGVGPKAHFGKINRSVFTPHEGSRRTMGEAFLQKLNDLRWSIKGTVTKEEKEAKNKERMDQVREQKNLTFARTCLEKGIIVCKTTKKPEKPIHCAIEEQCNNKHCPGYKYVIEICVRYGVDKNGITQSKST